ncbi:ladderlectin-like [Oreochromis niloticus]|uniref:ladderlectin-like n=1 Tax=Oreochromis niloticus TaxID=8128 RepID=UPI000674B847|nr:ladderlectin-like [Oreochromis niloticus]
MKLLTASALLCAMMALTAAAGEWYILNKPPSCPCGWTEYYDQCFFYVSEALAWVDAQRKCESMNANLASVHSLEEYQLLQRVIFDATKASERTWIGGFDGQREGYWFWIDGTRFQYTNWCKSEPNNHRDNEQCMEMNFSGDKCMNDQNCQTNSHLSALRESDDS